MHQHDGAQGHQRTWGIRFSVVDGIVLALATVVTPWLVSEIGTLGLIPGFVVLHFFLFCNVFRIRRVPELIWGLCFVSLAGLLTAVHHFAPAMLMLWQLPVTVILIAREIRHPNYHGVFADQVNPRLDDYLSESGQVSVRNSSANQPSVKGQGQG